MQYIILTITVVLLIGCGSNGGKVTDTNTPPKSPQVKDVKNIPPSVPKI